MKNEIPARLPGFGTDVKKYRERNVKRSKVVWDGANLTTKWAEKNQYNSFRLTDVVMQLEETNNEQLPL